ncbi:hypothetical protein ANTPLA_LOCUS7917 [Anthophora plagiata]
MISRGSDVDTHVSQHRRTSDERTEDVFGWKETREAAKWNTIGKRQGEETLGRRKKAEEWKRESEARQMNNSTARATFGISQNDGNTFVCLL